jgi:hypothetical protein
MNPRSLDALAGRLDRLERECRAWRRGAAVVALAAVVLLVAGADDPPPQAGGAGRPTIEELNVKRIIVRDEQGREAITLGTQEGSPTIALLAEGQERMSLSAPGGAGMMAFIDGGGPRLTFGLSSGGSPVVNFLDAEQHRRLTLGIFPKVGPIISVLDEQNKVTFKTP